MDDFKVGDIVGFRHLQNTPHRGVIVGFGTFKPSMHPAVLVFWFETGEKARASPSWLFKVEDRGV